jgi:hypothetical protein
MSGAFIKLHDIHSDHAGLSGNVHACLPAAPRMGPTTFKECAMSTSSDPLKPGDEASPGTPGAGEDLCEACGGTGKQAGGADCPMCEGSGRVMRGIGGG